MMTVWKMERKKYFCHEHYSVCSVFCDFAVSGFFSIYRYLIAGVKNIVRYNKDLVNVKVH